MVISAETAPPPPQPQPPTPPPPPHQSQAPSPLPLLQQTLQSSPLKPWGKHRPLRCLNVNRKGDTIASGRRSAAPWGSTSSSMRIGLQNALNASRDDAVLEEVRAKLLVHLQEAADRIQLAIPVAKPFSAPNPHLLRPTAMEKMSSSSPPDAIRPWNLRTRRAPILNDPSPTSSAARAVRLRSVGFERRGWPKISISLSYKEIEEDVYAVTGSRPRRRPRKRPRILQRQLDLLLPGSWLPSITPEAYHVPDRSSLQ